MLKLRISSDDFDSIITVNDRGDWVIRDTPGLPLVVVEGFGGENFITVTFMGMQSGKTHISVQFISIDSPIITKEVTITGWDVSPAVNYLIAKWYKEIGIIETEEDLQAHFERQRV